MTDQAEVPKEIDVEKLKEDAKKLDTLMKIDAEGFVSNKKQGGKIVPTTEVVGTPAHQQAKDLGFEVKPSKNPKNQNPNLTNAPGIKK